MKKKFDMQLHFHKSLLKMYFNRMSTTFPSQKNFKLALRQRVSNWVFTYCVVIFCFNGNYENENCRFLFFI